MPINPTTGIWENSVSQSPGPGGVGSPIGGFLSVMNAFTASDLARQAQAQRLQQEMEAIQKQAQSGGADLYSTPEGQSITSAYGISPETSSQIFESSPNRRIRSGMAGLKEKYGDEQIPSSELESLYLGEGISPPSGLYGYMGRQEAAKVATEKTATTAATAQDRIQAQLVERATPAAVAALKASMAAGEDEATQRNRFESAFGPSLALLNPKNKQAVEDRFQQERTGATGGATPMSTARIGELEQRTLTESARADYLDQIAEVRKQAQKEKESTDPLRKQILQLHIAALQSKANGTMTPQARASLMTKAAALQKEIANRSNLTGLELSPQAKPANDALIADNKKRLAEINGLLAANTKAKATAPTGTAEPTAGWQEGDTVHYPDGTSSTLTGGVWSKRS